MDLYGQAISEFSASEFVELVADEKHSELDKWSQQTKMRYVPIILTFSMYYMVDRLQYDDDLLCRYGSLLAHSCQSTLMIGNNTELLLCGKHFGLEIALAWQV